MKIKILLLLLDEILHNNINDKYYAIIVDEIIIHHVYKKIFRDF